MLSSLRFTLLLLLTLTTSSSAPASAQDEFGCPPSAATLGHYNGSDINLDRMFGSTAVIGATWTAVLTPQPLRGPGSWIILMRSAPTIGPTLDVGTLLSLPPAGDSENLLGGTSIGVFFGPPHGGGGTTTTFALPVPFNCALVGMTWNAQSVVFGDLPAGAGLFDPWFSSASGGIVGTF